VRTKEKPQISPLRYAPVEMTILFEHVFSVSSRVPRNCRSLGFARDDKGKGNRFHKEWLLNRGAFQIYVDGSG
jgi:hypothetical protein